jgi:hypothetical protein
MMTLVRLLIPRCFRGVGRAVNPVYR